MAQRPHAQPAGAFALRPNHGLVRVGGVTAVLAVFLAAWFGYTLVTAEAEPAAPTTAQAASGPPLPAAFAPSHKDTTPDGDLRRAAEGSPQSAALPYAALRRLFDYYLSTLGERELPAILAQIEVQLSQQLRPAQVPPAKRLLDKYIAFKRALVDLEVRRGLAGQGTQAIRARMVAQQALRAQYFDGFEIEAMFAMEDAYDADAIARLEVSQNTKLTPEQKQKMLVALDAALPATLRADRDATVHIIRVEDRVATLREKGASDDDVYRLRASEFDPSAAARLAELDREEAQWARRIAAYRHARASIFAANPGKNATELQTDLLALQEAMFTPDERRRLTAYDAPAGP